MNDILLWALLFVAVSILIAAILVLRVIKIFVQQSLYPTYFVSAEEKEKHQIEQARLEAEKPEKKTLWNWVLGLRPISEEKDLVMEHEFDGIAELDNPTPAWFMVLFYGTIIFAIGYMANYHVFG